MAPETADARPAEDLFRPFPRALLVILGATVLLPLAFYLGPRYGDHFWYVRVAADIVQGDYRPSGNRYGLRFGMIFPLAALQLVTGSWPVSAAIFTLAASVAHVLGVYALGARLGGRPVGLWAAALVAILPLETINGSTPFPDLLTAALGTWAFVLAHRESRASSPRPGLLLAAGALLAWGYLVKQTVVFHLLALGVWALATRRWRWAWIPVPVAAAILLEWAVLAATTGDPFIRIADARADAVPLVEQWYRDTGGVTARLLWHVPSLLLNPLAKDFPYLAGLAWAFLAAIPRIRAAPGGKELLAGAALLLVQIWFWPSRLSPYVPSLIAEGRHFFPLCAPLAVGVAILAVSLSRRKRFFLYAVFAGSCLFATTAIYLYLSREDAGLRAAHRVLRERGAVRVRALDAWGHLPMLLPYLDGPRGRMEFRDYQVEDLDGIHGEHVVVDERTRVHDGRNGTIVIAKDLVLPGTWQKVWEKSFPTRWDPRKAGATGEHRVSVYYAP